MHVIVHEPAIEKASSPPEEERGKRLPQYTRRRRPPSTPDGRAGRQSGKGIVPEGFGNLLRYTGCLLLLIGSLALGQASSHVGGSAPYPPSNTIGGITWDWQTYTNAAPGSDLWPVTWGPDDELYAAWGDGGGFGGSDSDGRVALGIARIEGSAEHWHGLNINGGKNPQYPASFAKKGKTTGIAFVDGVLYATVNLEDGTWPDVNHALFWSTNQGATWTRADWLFPKGAGNFQPAKFLAFGKDYTGVPTPLAGYVYLYGPRQSADR